jgi:hypothetical protein
MSIKLKKLKELYVPKSADEKKFVDKHVVAKTADANKNDDAVFDGSKVKTIKRKETRHGYDNEEDVKVYEELEHLDEISHEGAVRAASVWKNKGDYRRSMLYTKLAKALEDGDRTTAAGYEAQLRALQEENIDEKLKPSMGAGEYVSDFQKSNAPQFAGKSKEKRRMMGIAAYLSAKKGGMKEGVELEEDISKMSTDKLKKHWDKHKDESGASPVFAAQLKQVGKELAKRKALRKEEVEHLDELDKSTMRSYVGKAAVDIARSGITQGMLKYQSNKEIMAKHISKRLKGIDTATKKLAYEEVDVSLLELYINLDEDNRNVMLSMIEKGLREELLQFAQSITEHLDANNN